MGTQPAGWNRVLNPLIIPAVLLPLVFTVSCGTGDGTDMSGQFVRPENAPVDVLPEYDNLVVTALSEDCETVRLALGGAWDDALSCRALSGYLRPWDRNDWMDRTELLIKRGVALYELVKCVDDGIQSVRLARDSRDAPGLMEECAFWRNELSLAASSVARYADEAADLNGVLRKLLADAAKERKISAARIEGIPWENPERETWRRTGPILSVRLPIDPHPESFSQWWNTNLSFEPGYIVTKLRSAGDVVVLGEVPVGAWGVNCTAEGTYDWTGFNRTMEMLKERRCRFLLELPTLTPLKDEDGVAAEVKTLLRNSDWLWLRYAAPLPAYLAENPETALIAAQPDGSTAIFGGVQLFNPAVREAYGAYLEAMAANLREQGLYDTVAAIHLEMDNATGLPDDVDYSAYSLSRWRGFLEARYLFIGTINQAWGTRYASFFDIEIPRKVLDPRAAADWKVFSGQGRTGDTNAWGKYLLGKYKTKEGIEKTIGKSWAEGYGWRLPFDYTPVVKTDYLHFRREWVTEYLTIKRALVEKAFPDKLVIDQKHQFGGHTGISESSEDKWGGLLGDDFAQFTGVGPNNEDNPFLLRSADTVGFGTRPSDSLETLLRDNLWIQFTNPGNLARYFYDWVAHGYLDYQFGWHSVTNHWLTNQLFYAIGPTVANTAPEPQRIGLVMPRATLDLYDGPIYYEYMGWDWILNAAKLTYTRIDEHLIRNGGLKSLGLEVLILPAVGAMDKTVAREIAEWVDGGGLLIASTIPGKTDVYGRPLAESPLAAVLGVRHGGTTSEAVRGTPLTVTIPRGIFTGGRAETTDRTPAFEVLTPVTATVMETYESGKPAITVNGYGNGRAVTLGYPFGVEAVIADKTSIGFQRTYTWFVREPQVIDRVAWLSKFIVDDLGFNPEYGVEYADVGRFDGKEARAMGLGVPKGFSEDPDDFLFISTVGDRRSEHELEVKHEIPDAAIRFFPRHRDGLATTFLGISTRDVHYISPRGTVNMVLSEHTYHCRINNSRIQAIWDVARDVPVGFERDDTGVTFTISLPSGHIMMLAYSEEPDVQLFGRGEFPGLTKEEVIQRTRTLAGGETPPDVVILAKDDLRPWFEHIAASGIDSTVTISYGEPSNKPAAETLAGFLREEFGMNAVPVEQVTTTEGYPDVRVRNEYVPLIYIGNDWSNNDLALQGAFWNWNSKYGPHLPFTATYMWPGEGRAVVSLSRKYALINENGQVCTYRFNHNWRIRPVEDRFPQVRRRLYIGGDGSDAERAVRAIIAEIGRKPAN